MSEAIENGARTIVLSDRHSNAELAPIPSLLLTSAIHHHLVREKTRTQVGLVVEAGDVREVHHVALLIGYGAAGVNPYLAIEIGRGPRSLTGVRRTSSPRRPSANVIKALGKGVLKVMSKMGISTVASLHRARRSSRRSACRETLVDQYFTGTTSKLGGIGLTEIAEEVQRRHLVAYPADGIPLAHRDPAGRRRVPVAPRGRAAPVRPGDRVPAAALHPVAAATTSSSSTPGTSTTSPSG